MGVQRPEESGIAPESLVFYVDADLLGIAMALARVRNDVTYAGAPGCPVKSPNVKDHRWLPIVGKNDWVVIMKDDRIRYRSLERHRFLEAGLRVFCLTTSGNRSSWDILGLLVRFWDEMERVARSGDGPYIYSVTQLGVRPLFVPKTSRSGRRR